MNICVTGGAGYIGSELVARLRAEGHDVDVIDWKNNNDLFNVEYFDYEVIYHLAALAGNISCGKYGQDAVLRNNTDGCRHVAENCPEDTLLIYTSTSAIYGTYSLYADSKARGETILLGLHKKSIVFRLATIYGISQSMRKNLLVHDFIKSDVQDGFIVVRNKDDKRPFASIGHCLQALDLKILNELEIDGQIWDCFDSHSILSNPIDSPIILE